MTKTEIVDYIKSHPEMSIRKTATALGVAKITIERAKKSMSSLSSPVVSSLMSSDIVSSPLSSVNCDECIRLAGLNPKLEQPICTTHFFISEAELDEIKEQQRLIKTTLTTRHSIEAAVQRIIDIIQPPEETAI